MLIRAQTFCMLCSDFSGDVCAGQSSLDALDRARCRPSLGLTQFKTASGEASRWPRGRPTWSLVAQKILSTPFPAERQLTRLVNPMGRQMGQPTQEICKLLLLAYSTSRPACMHAADGLQIGAFTRYYCFTSSLYCTIILFALFANTPFIVQYIAQHYQLLHPPAKI